MTNWSHGYNVSTGYTFGFYRETAPDWIDLALAFRGYEPPRSDGVRRFRYLELGSGQGFGLCLLAAANPHGEFLGIDFSPEHTAHAISLASRLGLDNVKFVEGDFAILGAGWPAGYGEFDYVILHGIYSWVPETIREALVACLGAAVRPGGAVYLSYNSMPGWVSSLPFQHILRLLDATGASRAMSAIDAGRELFTRLEGLGSGVTKALPGIKARLEITRRQPAPYLVQEYLHDNWHPLWCSQVLEEMADAKLNLAATATMAENLLPGVLSSDFREILSSQPNRLVREDLCDCLINQSFRRDIYVRGVRKRLPREANWERTYRFWLTNLTAPPSDFAIPTSYGTVNLRASSFAPILEAVEGGGVSLAQLGGLSSFKQDRRTLYQTVILLLHAGWIGCGRQEDPQIEPSSRSNGVLVRLADEGGPYRHLASSVLGSAVAVTDTEMMMLEGLLHAPAAFEQQPTDYLKEKLRRAGRTLAKGGEPLSGDAETAELKSLVKTFKSQTLPLWISLGVIG